MYNSTKTRTSTTKNANLPSLPKSSPFHDETTMVLRQFLDGDEPKPMFAAFFYYPDRLIAGDVQIRGPRHFHCCLYHENELQYLEKVIQGSHMVSGDRCPACSDQLKKWSESRAAAPKGRCPVGHRGEFPYVLRGHIWGNFP